MSLSKKAVIAVAIAVALGVGAAALALSRLDVERAADSLREVVAHSTGRTLEIHGGSRIELGVPPNLVFEELTLTGAGEATPIARAKRLEVQIELLPLLLERRVRLARIVIDGAELEGDRVLDRPDASARPSGSQDPDREPSSLPRVIRLRDVRWTRPASSGDAPTVATIEHALVETTRGGRASIRGRGAVHGRAVDLRGDLGRLDEWGRPGGEVEVDLAGTIASVGTLDLVARVRRADHGERLRIDGKLRADHLAWPGGDAAAGATGDLFSETRFPRPLLDGADARIELAAPTLALGRTRLREVGGTILLERGALQLDELRARVGGGRVTGHVALDAGRAPPAFALALRAADVDLSALLREAGATGRLRGGIASAEVRLDGRGESPAAVAASLEGEIKALVGRARARTTLFDSLVVGPTQVLGKVTGQTSAWTTIECAAADLPVRGGIARPGVLLAATPRTTLVGKGRIDFRSERIALEIAPATTLTDPAIGLPLTVRGPLSRPRAQVDELGAARKLGGLVSIAAFPPAAIASLAELGSERHPCVAIAAGRRPERESALVRGARETGESVVGRVTDGARKLGESVGLLERQ